MNGLAEILSDVPPEASLSTDAQNFLTALLSLGNDLAANDKASLLALLTVMQDILNMEIERIKRLIASNAKIALRLKVLTSSSDIPAITEVSDRLTSVKAAMSQAATRTEQQSSYAVFETGLADTMVTSLSVLSNRDGYRGRVNALVSLARQDAARLEAYLNGLRDMYSVVEQATEELA